MLAGTPIIWYRRKAVAILDERCYIERCSDGQAVYVPADPSWLAAHPIWLGNVMGREVA